MPRTKIQRKKRDGIIVGSVQEVNINPEVLKKNLKKTINSQLQGLGAYCKKELLHINSKIANITISEFNKLNSLSNITGTSSIQHILDRTRTTTKHNSRILTVTRRSNSFDEGYLTAGSSNGTTAIGGRESRTIKRQLKSRRMSKSLSPNTILTTTATTTTNNKSLMRKYQTPQNRLIPSNAYGMITPKVNPNTPQVLLRRPKDGEVVLSLQGSPLYTGGITMDQVANINIPLEDGKLLSLQPRRGLRLSQIPELQPETARQLEMLRDNLNKVCAVSAKR